MSNDFSSEEYSRSRRARRQNDPKSHKRRGMQVSGRSVKIIAKIKADRARAAERRFKNDLPSLVESGIL